MYVGMYCMSAQQKNAILMLKATYYRQQMTQTIRTQKKTLIIDILYFSWSSSLHKSVMNRPNPN